jgi:putative nucleotidyltransferase with HDIG domain
MVLDRAREIGADLPGPERETLQWAALCHDLGKPATTRVEEGRVRALQHDRVGAEIARNWLGELRVSNTLAAAVAVLVADHLAPAQFVVQGAGARAYRRLARRLAGGGMTVVDLERLARADQLGRTTESARAGRFDEGPLFLAAAEAEGLLGGPIADVVRSEHLVERGIEPGAEFGIILARARHLQDEHGWADPDRLLEAALDSVGLPAFRSGKPESDPANG